MEKNNIGELIINHYEEYLGIFEEARLFKGDENMPSIQLLQYDKVFDGCKVYASLGISKFSELIQNTCEVVMIVDDDYQNTCSILANVLFYIIKNNMSFGRGTYVEGIKNINQDFSFKHNKDAIYFTEPYAFPDEFSDISKDVKMYLAFFISEKECNYIKKHGCEKFEDYLEENNVDIMDINR